MPFKSQVISITASVTNHVVPAMKGKSQRRCRGTGMRNMTPRDMLIRNAKSKMEDVTQRKRLEAGSAWELRCKNDV